MPDPTYLTSEGAMRLKKELADLKGPQRLALSKRLREAIQMGDLSENADYHKAKEDQGFLEGRILELEHILRNAIIVEEKSGPKDVVEVGVRVTVQEPGPGSRDVLPGRRKRGRSTRREDLSRIPDRAVPDGPPPRRSGGGGNPGRQAPF